MAPKKDRLEYIGKSKLLGKKIKHIYTEVNRHNKITANVLYELSGSTIYLQLEDNTFVKVLCRQEARGFGISISKEDLTSLDDQKKYFRFDAGAKWNEINTLEVADVRYYFKKYKVIDSNNNRKKTIEVPQVLGIEFTNKEKIWISIEELDGGKEDIKSNNCMMLFFDKAAVENYSSVELNDEKDEAIYSELPLYEQFTIQGFFAVSTWAGAYAFYGIQFMFIGIELKLIVVNSVWRASAIIYVIMWIVLFLFMCLIPKLKGEK